VNAREILDIARECISDYARCGSATMVVTEVELIAFARRLIPAPQVSASDGVAAKQERQQMSDEVFSALIYALWRHQGGHSFIGQRLREILGKGQFDHLTTSDCAAAKITHDRLTQSAISGAGK
jgi:hypothetical protein